MPTPTDNFDLRGQESYLTPSRSPSPILDIDSDDETSSSIASFAGRAVTIESTHSPIPKVTILFWLAGWGMLFNTIHKIGNPNYFEITLEDLGSEFLWSIGTMQAGIYIGIFQEAIGELIAPNRD